MALLAERVGGGGIGFARRDAARRSSSAIRSPPASIAASCARICSPSAGERIGLDPMLAGQPANVEQPRLGLLEPRRIERQGVGGARDPVLGLARLDQRPVERRQRLGEQRMIGGAALDPPRRLAQLRQRAVRSAEQFVEAGQRFAGLEAGLHRRALLGEPRLLALLGRQRLDLRRRMRRAIRGRARRRRLRRAPRSSSASIRVDLGPGALDRRGVEPAEGVEQRAMALGIEQAAVVMLAVDLDRQRADVAQQPGRDAGVRRRKRGCRHRS